MPAARAPNRPASTLRGIDNSIYVLAVVVGLVGTGTLVTSVVEVHSGSRRVALICSGMVWLAAWVVLLIRDRQGRAMLAAHDADQRLLQTLAEARQAVLRNDDPRQALVAGVTRVSGAALAMLSEVRRDHLEVTASSGANVVGLRIPMDRPSVSRQVLVTGRPIQVADIHREETQADTLEHLETLIDGPVHSVAYVPIIVAGEHVGVLCACFSVTNMDLADKAISILTTLSDEAALAIEREGLLVELDRLSVQDPLTGLLNRRGWNRALDGLGRTTAMVMLDLDHFKKLNDAQGHAFGDRVLQAFARTMVDTCRDGDTIARIGGEEFAILSPDSGDVLPLVDRLRVAWTANGSPVTCSAGIAYRDLLELPEQMQERADEALYAAKSRGRNRTVEATVFDATQTTPDTTTTSAGSLEPDGTIHQATQATEGT